MNDPLFWMVISGAGLVGLGLTLTAALSGWRSWIELQRAELAHRGGGIERGMHPAQPAAARIELADLKERVRKLEAIAAGVDL
ncbi:hypothetical protein [Sphingomonas montanisoli]|uniref:Uncharacterized protein n=1 Tax=Sphingomonas montanisoli TaxID=2606412 RepID=A0A5D9C8T3_9SPHN|nr:hypothetical protein [Sphingomonas montanisoli]TZG27460.1 hypothetical protein FYJ91_07665 [Sphingomonas montanisoli]